MSSDTVVIELIVTIQVDAVQALCFLAGANSIFYGDRLLTTGNPDVEADRELFTKLGLAAM